MGEFEFYFIGIPSLLVLRLPQSRADRELCYGVGPKKLTNKIRMTIRTKENKTPTIAWSRLTCNFIWTYTGDDGTKGMDQFWNCCQNKWQVVSLEHNGFVRANEMLQATATTITTTAQVDFEEVSKNNKQRQLVENTNSIFFFFLLNCLLILCRIILLPWVCLRVCLCVRNFFRLICSAWCIAHVYRILTFYFMWAGRPSRKFR